MRLTLLHPRLAVCRLETGHGLPGWFTLAPPLSAAVVRGAELTLVAPDDAVPDTVRAERGWRALEVQGPLELTLTGVMAALSAPLARAGVSIFSVSTFDTDVVLVREERVADAAAALREAGHEVAHA